MRRITPALLAALLGLGCAQRPVVLPDEARLPEQPGTVVKVGTFGYGLVPRAEPGTRYAPDALPAEFQVDGLEVVFAGIVSSPPADARVWGLPLRLTSIRRAP
ncbi:MAG TPA: hypothetical protein VFO85_16300 [Vicinamibacteria bacterium]|nr:hypothetical protein [Vicinamibacteria bacterium]